MDKLLIYYNSIFYIYHAHAPVCTIIFKSRLHKYVFPGLIYRISNTL